MSSAVPTVEIGSYSVPVGLFVGGQFVPGHGDSLDTVNPATEETLGTVQTANQADVDNAVAIARECFETTWGTNTAGTERGRLMFKLADLMDAATEELAAIECADSGKPISWCKADIGDATTCLRYFAGAADKIQGATIEVDDRQKYASVRKEPIGVVLQICPWNYPIVMWSWKVAPALAAGCAIIFKPAENTPLSTLKLAELVHEAGYPAGAFNVLNGLGKTTGQLLVEHMDIDKVAFTGSTAVGRQIAITAAKTNLKRVTLELGGKSPNIVFASANLKEAAKWAAFGVFENMGQSCTAGSRVLVQESIYDEFIKLFVQAAQAVKVGNPLDADTFMGAQISKTHFERIMGYIEKGKQQGAKVATGGVRKGTKGYFVEPTIFENVSQENAIAIDEIFGPVAAVIKFKDEAEAIQIANATDYGLAAGVHSTDVNQIHRVTRRIKAGTVWINQYVAADAKIPFGGYKQSGWGRELGLQGLEAYLETKSVHHYYGDDLDWPIIL
ncbi:uncharacterized protein L969DRAFT_91469 [Mixia osmundae IAM 14324]|nr:uncharacterized protein L969DRAFT_91469 [Mixia osmundae IAM 14324]KEI42001.1 hypothetical protein L969DRAFT_91469 [Mixia osmundae IAM 14324]